MPNKKTFSATKIRLSELKDTEARTALEMQFSDYRVQKELSVETQRAATIAALEARVQESKAQAAMMKFLVEASEHFSEVKVEPIWFAYQSEGEIILESPFTERDMRNTVRLQRKQLDQAASQMDNGEKEDDLYEQGEE